MQIDRVRVTPLVIGSLLTFCGAILTVGVGLINAGYHAYGVAGRGGATRDISFATDQLLSSVPFWLLIFGLTIIFATLFTHLTISRFSGRPGSVAITNGVTGSIVLMSAGVLSAAQLPLFSWAAIPLVSFAGVGCGLLTAKTKIKRRSGTRIYRYGAELVRRTPDQVERDREFVEQYAVGAAQRKQETVVDRKTLVDERERSHRAKVEANNKMRAVARAAFLSHPSSTPADFERCWPEIRDNLLKHHAMQMIADNKNRRSDDVADVIRHSSQNLIRLASNSASARTVSLLTSRHPGETEDPIRHGERDPFDVIGACRDGDTFRLNSAIAAGANLNVSNAEGWTPLMIAALKSQYDIAETLITHGANLEAKNVLGWTALRFACSIADIEMAAALIQQGADVNSLDEKGWSLLMQAADEGNSSVVKMLLEFGANKDHRNLSHESALSVALRRGHADIVQILKKNPAEAKRIAVKY